MKKIIAFAVAAIGLTSAADAATYRYDVTMKQTELTVLNLWGWGPGEKVRKKPDGMNCEIDSYYGEHTCTGSGDFSKKRHGLDFLDRYKKTIRASVTIDEGNYTGYAANDAVMGCSGASVICNAFLGDMSKLSADSETFDVSSGNGWGWGWGTEVSGSGFYYEDDGAYNFTLGKTQYSNSGAGLIARYETKKLRVSRMPEQMVQLVPNPLPASAFLIAGAMGALGFTARRRKAQGAS